MRFYIFLIGPALTGTGCKPHSPPSVQARLPLPHLTVVDIPGSKVTSVTISPKNTLRKIAAKTYGHEDFAGFIAALNKIPNPHRVVSGMAGLQPHADTSQDWRQIG